jgi:hypothetical protein
MAPARLLPTENSAVGLALLEAVHKVVVTGEEHHQGALVRYAPQGDGRPRQVAVELRFAPIRHGQYAGQRGIEVLLDGQRVGELTHRMALRYGPLVEHVLRGGGRPACIARVIHGRRGIEVELRLPASSDRSLPAPVRPPARPTPEPIRPRPSGRPGRGSAGGRRNRKPYWIGAGVAVLLLVIGGSLAGHDPVTPTAAGTTVITTPVGAPTTSRPAPPPETGVDEPDVGAPETSARSSPKPVESKPTRSKPTTRAKPTPAADTVSGSTGSCNPNYSGCVPIASDVDCAGGSGNGPKYVSGPIRVTGSDVYDLDRDGNGIACE